jgi:1-acyl-sn-glycerol-3-phosphate acyltransferase
MGGIERMGSTRLRLWRLALYLGWTLPLMPVQLIGVRLGCSWTATFPASTTGAAAASSVSGCGASDSRRRCGRCCSCRTTASYADITVLGSQIAGSFIAKTEVAGWPLFGWLAKLQRTVFVDRQVRSTAQQRDAITDRLAAKDALILFPEGTSDDGNRVLPFKSALFSVAESTDGEPVVVQPVSIAYTRLNGTPFGRRYRPLVAWYGDMALAPHLWTMLGLGTIEAVVEFHAPTSIAECGSRKALAQYCYDRVAGGVADALGGRREMDSERRPRTRRKPIHSDVATSPAG